MKADLTERIMGLLLVLVLALVLVVPSSATESDVTYISEASMEQENESEEYVEDSIDLGEVEENDAQEEQENELTDSEEPEIEELTLDEELIVETISDDELNKDGNSIVITFNYYTIYDENNLNDESRTILFRSVEKTYYIGQTYCYYPSISVPYYDEFVFDNWYDQPDLDYERRESDAPAGNKMSSGGRFYGLSQFEESGGGTVNVYAHWYKGNGISVNVTVGEHGRYEDPYNVLTDLNVGDSFSLIETIDGNYYSYYGSGENHKGELFIITDYGYDLDGVYLDENYTQQFPGFASNVYTITQDLLDESGCLNIYIGIIKDSITIHVLNDCPIPDYYLSGTYSYDDVFPEYVAPRYSYTFMGIFGQDAKDPSRFIEIIPGKTRIGEIYYEEYYGNTDQMVVHTRWRDDNNYRVTFHLNNSSTDVKTTKVWTRQDRDSELTLPGGALSDNSSFEYIDGAQFAGWSTADGKEFKKWQKASDVMSYMNDMDDYALDLYAIWERYSYTVTYHLNKGDTDVKITKEYVSGDRNSELKVPGGTLSDNSSFEESDILFSGWRTADGKAFDKGQTVYSLMRYMDTYNLGSIDLYAIWEQSTYDVTYHMNVGGSDIKVTKTYTGQDRISELKIPGGTLSDNSSFENVNGELFVCWSTEDGKEFEKGQRVMEVMQYMNERGLDAIDLYSVWDHESYTVTYHLNNSNADVKITKVYTRRDRNSKLRIPGGALSDNSSFEDVDANLFLGWKTENGRAFDQAQSVGNVMRYMSLNGLSKLDLYGNWYNEYLTVNVITSDHCSVEDPKGILTKLKVGNGIRFIVTSAKEYNEYYKIVPYFTDYAFVIMDAGYDFDGIYLDENYTKEFKENYPYYYIIKQEILDENDCLNLNIRTTEDRIKIRIKNDCSIPDYDYPGIYAYDDFVPEMPIPKYSYTFMGFYGRDAKDPSRFIEIKPGETKISDIYYEDHDYDYHYYNELYYEVNPNTPDEMEIYTQWRDDNTYKVTFHLNNSSADVKVTKMLTRHYRDSELKLPGGVLSDNSSFEEPDEALFIGWATSDGKEFKKWQKASDVMSYMNDTDNYVLDLYAIWERTSYTVTYHLNKGDTDVKITKEYVSGDMNSKLKVPGGTLSDNSSFEESDILFSGWRTADGKAFDKEQTVYSLMQHMKINNLESVDLYAIWEHTTYDVTYHMNVGGSDIKVTKTYTGQDRISELKIPGGTLSDNSSFENVNGELFVCWSTEDGKEFENGRRVMEVMQYMNLNGLEKIDLYAVWDHESYNVTYHLNNGGADVKTTKVYTRRDRNSRLKIPGGALSDNSSFEGVDGNIFQGWITGDGKLFDKGENVNSLILYMSLNKLASIDLYAKWPVGSYVVEFKADATEDGYDADAYSGSEFSGFSHSEVVEIGQTYNLSGKEFVRIGYTLDHWLVGTTEKTLKPTESFNNLTGEGTTVTLTAVWKCLTYSVKLDVNGGVLPVGQNSSFSYNVEEVQFPNKAELPVPTREGFAFGGWYEGTQEYTYYGGKDVYKNLNLVAKWDPVVYELLLDPNEGTIDGQESVYTISKIIAFSESVDLSPYKAVREGYTFAGWKCGDKLIKATQKVSKLTTINGDSVTLVSQWNACKYGVTYKYNGGALPKGIKNSGTYLFDTEIVLNNPERAGYIFSGWTLRRKGTEDMQLEMMGDHWHVTGPVTLLANWEPLTYNCNIIANFGNHIDRDSIEFAYSDSADFTEALRGLDADEQYNIKGLSLTQWGTSVKYLPGKKYKTSDIVKAVGVSTKPTSTAAERNFTLYAVTSDAPKNWYITYLDMDGAKLSKNMTAYKKSGKKVTLPKAIRTGYSFLGWELIEGELSYFDSKNVTQHTYEGEIERTIVTAIKPGTAANVAVSPVYEAKQYKIKLSPNAKDVTEHNYKVKTDIWSAGGLPYIIGYDGYSYGSEVGMEDINKIAESWERKGYSFKGWGTKSSTKVQDRITTLANLTTGGTATLYALWEADTHEITYSKECSIDSALPAVSDRIPEYSETVTHTFGKALKLKKLTVSGYTFAGWKVSDGMSDGLTFKNGFVTQVTRTNLEDHEFYAAFTENVYNVKLNTQSGIMRNALKDVAFKGTQVVIQNTKYSEDISQEITECALGASRPGYYFVGIAFDSKGKNMLLDRDGRFSYKYADGISGLSAKNKGTVTLYAIWEKAQP